MAETSGLLNRRRGITPTEGSNPSVSARANIRRRSPLAEIQQIPFRLGRPQPFIYFVERGERRVDVIEFYAIMKALGADPEKAFRELIAQLPGRLEI